MSKVRIAHSPLVTDISLMKQTCEEREIFVFETLTAAHVSVAGAEQGYFLEVKTEDAERAIEVLKDLGFGEFIVGSA